MIGIAEAASLVGCSERTIRRAVKSGRLSANVVPRPGHASASVYRLSEQDVKEWALRSHRSHVDTPASADGAVQALQAANARLAGEVEFLRGRIVFLEKIALALQPAQVDVASGQVQAPGRRGFWSRFRRH